MADKLTKVSQVSELIEGLKEWQRHYRGCGSYRMTNSGTYESCDCGLDEAQSAVAAALKQAQEIGG